MLAVLALICLVGCGRTHIVTVGGNEMAGRLPEKTELFLQGYDFKEEGEYYLGSGIRVNMLSEAGDEIASEELMFPVFRGDELFGLLLSGETDTMITEQSVLSLVSSGTDGMFDMVRIGGGLYMISSGSTELITGEATDMTDQEKKSVEAIRGSVTEKNRMGEEKTLFKTIQQQSPVTLYDPETGKTYSSSRIVVKFTEGDEEEKILLFEAFCGGRLHGRVRAAGRYTFTFGAKQNIKQLKALLRSAKELEYVTEAMLEEAREMH